MPKPEVHIYLETKAQLALVKQAARLQDKSITRFCLRAVLKVAEETMRQATESKQELTA